MFFLALLGFLVLLGAGLMFFVAGVQIYFFEKHPAFLFFAMGLFCIGLACACAPFAITVGVTS